MFVCVHVSTSTCMHTHNELTVWPTYLYYSMSRTLHQLPNRSPSSRDRKYYHPARLDCFSLSSITYCSSTWLTLPTQMRLSTMTISCRSLYRNWRPVTVEEMKGFIAVILNMGTIQLTDLKDYWSTDDTTDFHLVFSRDRIFGMLYVRDPDGTTKRSKIQPLLHHLRPVFEASFTGQGNFCQWISHQLQRKSFISSVSERKATPLGNKSVCAIRQQHWLSTPGACVCFQI